MGHTQTNALKTFRTHFKFAFELPKPIDYSVGSLTEQFDSSGPVYTLDVLTHE